MKIHKLTTHSGLFFSVLLSLLLSTKAIAATSDTYAGEGNLSSVSAACFDKEFHSRIDACLDNELAQANTKLTTLISQLRNDYLKLNSAGTPAAIKSLDNAYASFIKFRHSECKRIGDTAFGGTGAGDFTRACEVDLTLWYHNILKHSDLSPASRS